jgi:hypothetical protein
MLLGRRADVMCDIMSTWRAIVNGIVAKNTSMHERYWAHLTDYCAVFGCHSYLIDCNNMEKIIIITA